MKNISISLAKRNRSIYSKYLINCKFMSISFKIMIAFRLLKVHLDEEKQKQQRLIIFNENLLTDCPLYKKNRKVINLLIELLLLRTNENTLSLTMILKYQFLRIAHLLQLESKRCNHLKNENSFSNRKQKLSKKSKPQIHINFSSCIFTTRLIKKVELLYIMQLYARTMRVLMC